MNRKRAGIFCILAGTALIASALLLLLANQSEDRRAGQAAGAALSGLQGALSGGAGVSALKEDDAMTVAEIDGRGYIGYLSIPALELALPVLSEGDEDGLKIAPCRQFGTAGGDNLVIAGHNYQRHFGKLSALRAGDLVQFTDMDGGVGSYLVDTVCVVPPTEDLKDSGWDLVLYTCTYSGQERILVGCGRVRAEESAFPAAEAF